MKHALSIWMLLVIGLSCVLGIVYWVVQQDMRVGANALQAQIAEDTVTRLNTHKQLTFSQESIDIAKSLSPFIITFDLNGNVRSSEAVLDGKTPIVPPGVFAYTKTFGEDRLTWQPKDDVRIAAVIVPYNNGFVLAGRNLREVEKQEDQLMRQIVLGWTATVGITFVASLILLKRK